MNVRVPVVVGVIALMCLMGGAISQENDIVQETVEAAVPASELLDTESQADLEIPEVELDSVAVVDTDKAEKSAKVQIKRIQAKMSKDKTALENSKATVSRYQSTVDAGRKQIESLVDKLKENTLSLTELGKGKAGDLEAAFECLAPPEMPPSMKLGKVVKVKQLKWHYKKLCAGELRDKAAAKEKSSKTVEGRQKIAAGQMKSHYAVIEKHQKAAEKAKDELNSKSQTEVISKAKSEKKVKGAREVLDKANEKLVKEQSLKQEKEHKESSKKAENKGKECETKKVKESATKLAQENQIKGLKKKLSEKCKLGKEKEEKIYTKWHEHLAMEKKEKAAEIKLKKAKEGTTKEKESKEGKKKKKAEAASKSTKLEKSTKKAEEENSTKLKAEKSQKELYEKGTVKEDAHKKESIAKELKNKQTDFAKWKESFTKASDEKKSKAGDEFEQKCAEKKKKFGHEKISKSGSEVKEKHKHQEANTKPELRTKETHMKEGVVKKGHESNAKGYEKTLKATKEQLHKSTADDKEHQKKCGAKVKAAQEKLAATVKEMKKNKKEAANKKEMTSKIEDKKKHLEESEKKEKASEKKMKATTESNGKVIKKKEVEAKKVADEKYEKKTKEVKAKCGEGSTKSDAKSAAAESAGKINSKREQEKRGKNPFVGVKEINLKISGMKESFEKSKAEDVTGQKARDAKDKFSLAKEKFFKKYSAATHELKNKKEMFEKKCEISKEKRGKITMASAAYSERLSKKQCLKTRHESEVSNKNVMKYFDNSIASLKSKCDGISSIRKEQRHKFVWEVCEGVHNDVEASIAKVMTAMKKVGKSSYNWSTEQKVEA
jgi:hypothetical protein